MKLTELNPELKVTNGNYSLSPATEISQADCLMFLCPTCFEKNNGEVGTHEIMVHFENRKVPEFEGDKKEILLQHYQRFNKWEVSGDSLENLTLTPSILIKQPGCGAHFFIRNGEIIKT